MYDKLFGEAKHECVLDETQSISWIAIRVDERKGLPTTWHPGNVLGPQRFPFTGTVLDGRAVQKSRENRSSGSEELWSGTFA
jgi:hypothetical protein